MVKPKTVAFITTPNFRKTYKGVIESFIRTNLYPLTQKYQVICSGRTYEFLKRIRKKKYGKLEKVHKNELQAGMNVAKFRAVNYRVWQHQIAAKVSGKLKGAPGVIEILFELVAGRLAGMIHLTHPEDLEAKADSSVLWREANVHNIPIAHDITTAGTFIDAWANGARSGNKNFIPVEEALVGIEDKHNVLAMIAHDGKKMEICEFAVANADEILKKLLKNYFGGFR